MQASVIFTAQEIRDKVVKTIVHAQGVGKTIVPLGWCCKLSAGFVPFDGSIQRFFQWKPDDPNITVFSATPVKIPSAISPTTYYSGGTFTAINVGVYLTPPYDSGNIGLLLSVLSGITGGFGTITVTCIYDVV
jgi:hypothetical protein